MVDFLLVFGLSFIVEVARSTYTIFVSRGYRLWAVISSASFALFRAYLIYKVIFAIETLPALVIGYALGTFAIMTLFPNNNLLNRE